MNIVGEVSVIQQGPEVPKRPYDIEWKLFNFSSLSDESDEFYKSPSFSFLEESWYLRIYPNGTQEGGAVGYVSLYLFIQEMSSDTPIDLEFSLGLKRSNGKKFVEHYCFHSFTKIWTRYGVYKCLLRSDIFEKRQFFKPTEVFTVFCSLKYPSHAENRMLLLDDSARANCSYCKETFDAQEISFHEKKCRVKCPECSNVVLYQKWQDHQCQMTRAEASTNTTESFVVHYNGKIQKDFKQVFLKRENCDVILRVKGQEFQAHKVILAARSPVFASTFRNDMKEKESGIVDIEDCDPSVFPAFLCFLYSEDVDSLADENIFSLFRAADKYDVPDLREKCLEFMKMNLSIEAFCETLTVALQHSETELIHLSTDFFIRNAKKILITVKWQSFAAENPTQSNELFIKFVESVGG